MIGMAISNKSIGQTNRKISRRLLLLSLLGALVFPCSACAEKFVVAWAAVSALNSPFWVMNDAGFLKQEGLDIDFVYIASSPTVARATLAGDLAISASNGQVIVDAGLNGADLIAIGAVTNVVAFYVMAHPEIKNVADLKGKAVGVTRFGAATDFGMRILLNKYGLEPVKDVPLVQIGRMQRVFCERTVSRYNLCTRTKKKRARSLPGTLRFKI